MKKVILATLAALTVTPAFATTAPYDANKLRDVQMEGYLIALNTWAPSRAKYTMNLKQFVEQKCRTLLTVEDLNSDGFVNIVTALDSMDTLIGRGIEDSGLVSAVTESVKKNTSCVSFDKDFELLVNDVYINANYPKFSNFVHAWDETVKMEKKLQVSN